MARSYTTDTLIDLVYRKALIPEDQATFSRVDIINMLNEEMSAHIMPLVLKLHEEYYVYPVDMPLVQNNLRYQIPYRAIGNKLRDTFYKDVSGNLYEMTRIDSENKGYSNYTYNTNRFREFYLENDSIILIGMVENSGVGSLQLSFFLRPNQLVELSRVATITAIDRVTGVITVDSIPANLLATQQIDFVAAKTPNKIIKYDVQSLSTDNNLKTITVDPETFVIHTVNGTSQLELAVGDYICTAEESPVPQCPYELCGILAQQVTIKCLEALGDAEGIKSAKEELAALEYNINTLIDNRVEGAPRKAHNKNSLLKTSTYRTRLRW